MADNDIGVNDVSGGTPVATDDIGGVHFQRVKVALGPNSTHTADQAGRAIGSDGVAYVDPRINRLALSATSSGLTTAATAYSIGDQTGAIMSLANAARASGGTGLITGIALLDEGDVTAAFDIIFFRATVTLAADNAAFAVSDADMRLAVARVSLPGMTDLGANRFGSIGGLSIPYDCSATTLFAALITQSANAVYTAATDLVLTVYVVPD